MILLEELKSKVDLLSVDLLQACDNVPDPSDVSTLNLSKGTRGGMVKLTYRNQSSHLLFSDELLTTLVDYLEDSFNLSEIRAVTYYVPSKKIVFTFVRNRIYIDPEEPLIELSNFTKGIKRKLSKKSIKVELDLIELLFKDSVNSLKKHKNDNVKTHKISDAARGMEIYKTSDSFRRMVDSVNHTVMFNRQYLLDPNDVTTNHTRIWDPSPAYISPQVEDDYVLDTPANREMIRQRELVERYNLANLEGLQNVPRYLNVQADTDTPMSTQALRESILDTPIQVDNHDYTATIRNTEGSIDTERLRYILEALQATEDADATATAIRFAENYLSN